jgi:hypothetical protein
MPSQLTQCNVWQQASGNINRDYADLCIRWSVILNGPGEHGSWPECKAALECANKQRKILDLKRFAVEMKPGDIVVLRRGTASVVAVGQVVAEYEWHDEFGDIDGWDIQHVRRVHWYWHSTKNPKIFPTWALKQGDTTQHLTSQPILEWIKTLVLPTSWPTALPALPVASRSTTVAEVSEYLFDQGVAHDSISHLMSEVGEIVRIGKCYQPVAGPSEHETVCFLVVPMLRALGWTPQKMGIEWHHVDVALFHMLPRSDETLKVVVEAKKMSKSCLSARSQALNYALGKKACHRLIVTDGLRYAIYRESSPGSFDLHAYLNLARLRNDYPALECRGAKEALLSMSPEWNAEIQTQT